MSQPTPTDEEYLYHHHLNNAQYTQQKKENILNNVW